MKKLLLSIALLASCASVIAVVPQFTASGGGQVQFHDPVIRAKQTKPRTISSHTQKASDPSIPIEHTVYGDGQVQFGKSTTSPQHASQG